MKRLVPALLALCLLAGCTSDLVPTDTQTPAPLPSGAPEGAVVFVPPGKLNTQLYDTSAIRKAYEEGAAADLEGLSEKDARVLACVQSVIKNHITGDMTDYEKELALHDWLMSVGTFDRSVFDPRTPQGADDSSIPYGVLINGAGTAVGYASAFQLFMDLVDIECITVVGAVFSSMEDHAWNMVKLEGEWYCVDPGWNKAGEDSHLYFNVTSQYMADTDHQWDYENVPLATATRFGLPDPAPMGMEVDVGDGEHTFWVEISRREEQEKGSGIPILVSIMDRDKGETLQSFEEEVTLYSFDMAEPFTEDVNFDGCADFGHGLWLAASCGGSAYYVWDKEQEKFVRDPYGLEKLSMPTFHQESKAIETWNHSGNSYVKEFYRYLDGTLTCIRRLDNRENDLDDGTATLTVEDYDVEKGELREVYREENVLIGGVTYADTDEFRRWENLDYHGT